MVFCSQTLSPAPTERRPPTFGCGRGLPFETRSGFRYERAQASVRDGGGENPLPQPGEAGNSVEMGVARIENERVLDGESGDPEVVRGDRRAGFF